MAGEAVDRDRKMNALKKETVALIEKLDHYNISGVVMTYDEFIKSVEDEQPSARLSETLTSLWWDKKGDWDTAHSIAQEIPTEQGSAVHAYLHREEGVLWNADYWYSRAGRVRPGIPLEEEWKRLVEEMIV